MKVLIKDNENEVIFETNKAAYCEIIQDEYDYTQLKTSTGSMVMNDIKSLKTYRIIGAPAIHEEEDNN